MKNGTILSQSTVGVDPGRPAPVAHTEREAVEQLTPKSGVNLPDYKIIVNQLLLYYGDNCGLGSSANVREFYKKNKLMLSPTMMQLYYYAKQNGVFLSSKLMEETDLPEGTYYRYIKYLLKHGFIKKVGRISQRTKRGVKGGPRPEIYAYHDYDPQPIDIIRIREQHFKEANPGIQALRHIIPMVIEEYVDPVNREVNYRDILSKIKKELPGYDIPPLAEEVAQRLHNELKIKVWR